MIKSLIAVLLACLVFGIAVPIAAQTTCSITDLTWNGGGHFYATEGNWDLDVGHGWITATHFGAYIKMAFLLPANSSIKLNLVETGLATDGLIGASVDGTHFQRTAVSAASPGGAAPATHQLTLASGLTAGVHSVLVWVASNSITQRWTPFDVLRVSGVEVSTGGTPVSLNGAVDVNGNPLTLAPKRMWVTGDSITEGYNDGGSFADGYFSWPILLGHALGCEVSNIAYSGAGYGRSAYDVPVPWSGTLATSSIANYFSGRPMTNGGHYLPPLQPDYFLTAYGRNDQIADSTANSPQAFSAALSAFLQGVRSLCDPAVKTTRIFCIVPFAQKNNILPYKTQIDAYFQTQTDKNCFEVALPLSDCYLDNSSADFNTLLGPTNETVDGIHPTLAEHQFLANVFTQIIGGMIASSEGPVAPTGLTARAGNTQISLNWIAVPGAVTYNLYRSTTTGGEGTTPYKTGLTFAYYTDTGLTNGTTYFYKLTAVNSVGESAPSDEASATPSPNAPPVYQINSGGPAIGTFITDNFYSAGNVYSFTNSVDTSNVSDPAPQAVYQSLRYDPNQFGYTLPNLTPNGAYRVRLHFVEVYCTIAGQRPFDVYINGMQVLSGFDPFTAAGGAFKAVVKEFDVLADADGTIGLVFSSPNATGPCVSAIEVLASTPAAPSPPTGLTAKPGNAQVVLSWNTVSVATSYNLYRATISGNEGTTPYKTGLTSGAYTDTAVTNGTTYFYKVTAVNSVGESAQSSEASATPSSSASVYQINSGGPTVGTFSADNFYTNGTAYTFSNPVDTSSVSNPAPAAVYQSLRFYNLELGYTLPNLTANGSYKVRLHFVEVAASSPGGRLFNLSINGSQVLNNFDIFAAAGGRYKAVVEEFNVNADANGKINLDFVSTNNTGPCVSAIEVLTSSPTAPSIPTGLTAKPGNAQVALTWNTVSNATSYNLYRSTISGNEGTTPYKTGLTSGAYTDTAVTNGTTYFYKVTAVNSVGESAQSSEASATPSSSASVYQINSGGPAVGTFSADNFYTNGTAYSFSNPVDISGVANPAPAAVYQSLRYLNPQLGYSLPNLTANGSYKVRLHFVEVATDSAGGRLFNLSINGSQVLNNFDIFAAAGGRYKAVVEEFNVNADANGKINLDFVSTNNTGPCVSAIEVLTSSPTAPSIPTGLTAKPGNAQVALTWNTVSNATSYNLYRSTISGNEGTTPYKTGLTSGAYTDTAVTNGTTYFYKVTAVNSVGESAQSSEASATPSSSASVYQINSGGPAVGTFSADNFYTNGTAYSFSNPVDISGVANPAPAAVYQSLRYLNPQLGYSLPNLTANGSYKVRLHFVEVATDSAGGRLFNLSINGTQVLSNFDIFAAAGGRYKAVVEEFNVNADANGKINLDFVSTNNTGPCVSAIEVLPSSS